MSNSVFTSSQVVTSSVVLMKALHFFGNYFNSKFAFFFLARQKGSFCVSSTASVFLYLPGAQALQTRT